MADKEQKTADEANPEVALDPEDGKEIDFHQFEDRSASEDLDEDTRKRIDDLAIWLDED